MGSKNGKSKMPLREFFETMYKPRRLLNTSVLTLKRYQNAFNHFRKFLKREPLVSDLNEATLIALITQHSEGRAPKTIETLRDKMMALANYAFRKNLLPEVPDVPKIRLPRKMPVSYTVDEIGRLIEAARKAPGEIYLIPARLVWTGLFMVAYDTGARATAVWSLEWTDYDSNVPALLFRAERQKQHCDQLLRISRQTADALEDIRQASPVPQKNIFPWDKHDTMKNYYIKIILAAAGLPNGRHDQMQRIRKTTASLMHRYGADATMQLGHSSEAALSEKRSIG